MLFAYWNVGKIIVENEQKGNMKPEYAGQMNMYLNYYNNEINDEYDNKPIGIILCKNKKEVAMH